MFLFNNLEHFVSLLFWFSLLINSILRSFSRILSASSIVATCDIHSLHFFLSFFASEFPFVSIHYIFLFWKLVLHCIRLELCLTLNFIFMMSFSVQKRRIQFKRNAVNENGESTFYNMVQHIKKSRNFLKNQALL